MATNPRPLWNRQPEPQYQQPPAEEPQYEQPLQAAPGGAYTPVPNNPYIRQMQREQPKQRQVHPPPYEQQYEPASRRSNPYDYPPPRRNYHTMEDEVEPVKKSRVKRPKLDLVLTVLGMVLPAIGAGIAASVAYYPKMPQATVNQMVPLALVFLGVAMVLQTVIIYRRSGHGQV